MGGAFAGFVSAALVPHHGWQLLFQVGGIAPLALALAAIFALPESVKYMALHESQRRRMTALVKAIRPDQPVPDNARFVIEDEQQSPTNPIYLFRNGLWLITPLAWLLFALNLMGFFFLISWMPTLLTAAKLPPATAALAAALMQVGGTVGALTLCWWLQRHRFLAIAIMFVLAVPVVGAIGFAGLTSTAALLTATFVAGFLVLGIQTGINVVGAMIYPTSLRASGSGWNSASAASARSSARSSAHCWSACRSRRSTCGRRCRSSPAPSCASRSISSTPRGCARIRSWRRRSNLRHSRGPGESAEPG